MGEVVREALQYLQDGQPKEEVADPKAKDKKGSRLQNETPADKHGGKDTTQYKEVAAALLKQIQLTTGSDEVAPGKDVDLLSVISDDNLLIQLFM